VELVDPLKINYCAYLMVRLACLAQLVEFCTLERLQTPNIDRVVLCQRLGGFVGR
jgi:hypothetical protein